MTSSTVGEVSSVTSKYKWVIKNFCTGCKNVGDFLSSPEFSMLSADGVPTKWQLQLYPKGTNNDSQNYLSIFLRLLTDGNMTVYASFAILDDKNNIVKESHLREKSFSKTLKWGWGRTKCLSRSYLMYMANKILVDNKLTIVCTISINPIESKKTEEKKIEDENNKSDSSSETDQMEEKKNRLRLLEFDTFERMITEEDQFSDVTLKIGKQTWKAHKCVLARRSSVLANIFQDETKDCVVNIENVDPDVFMEFMRFVYSGKVNGVDEKNAGELLILADRYQLDMLFQMCEETLSDNLDVGNVVKRLKLAHEYKAVNLKKTAVDFVLSNAKDIVVTPDFKGLTDVPEVLYEILHSMTMRDTDEK